MQGDKNDSAPVSKPADSLRYIRETMLKATERTARARRTIARKQAATRMRDMLKDK